MLLRLTPEFGGDGTVHGIIAMNDTGSDMLTLFNTDLLRLGNIQNYNGWQMETVIVDANGVMTPFPSLRVQVQLVDNENVPWSGSIIMSSPWSSNLVPTYHDSAAGIRRVLYIGTAPGNHLLAVSATKSGLTSLL